MTSSSSSFRPGPAPYAAMAAASARIIGALQHESGAYPACPTFSAYRGYAWLRDGAFTGEGMSRYGEVESASRFHDWVAGVLTARSAQVDALVAERRLGRTPAVGEMLPTRFTLTGQDGSDPWWDFQLDGYGTWLWSVVEHAARHGLDLARWRPGIEVAVRYLTAFWSLPCYDWWEEHVEQRHLSTLGAIYAGLRAASESGLLDPALVVATRDTLEQVRALALHEGLADGDASSVVRGLVDGGRVADGAGMVGERGPALNPACAAGRGENAHLAKWIGSAAVDASLAACVVPFGLVAVGDPVANATLDAVARDLDFGGGVHRFTADVFFGGGQWPLLSCLLGWNRAVQGRRDEALRYLDWAIAQAGPGGELPEQVDHHLLHPEHRAEWIAKWGTPATPLLWSHGMVLILATELALA